MNLKIHNKTARRILIGAYAYQLLVAGLWVPSFLKDPGVNTSPWLLLPVCQIGLALFIFQLIIRKKNASYRWVKFDLIFGILYLPLALFLYGFSFYLPIAFGHILASTKITSLAGLEVGESFYPYFFCLFFFDLFLLFIVNPSFKTSFKFERA